jgi:hypothetical protein
MQLRFFSIPALDPAAAEAELNHLLADFYSRLHR